MKLLEVLKEGVFDSISVEQNKTDLSVLARYYTSRQLSAVLKDLSDEQFEDLYTEARQRYTQFERVWKDVGNILYDLHEEYKHEPNRDNRDMYLAYERQHPPEGYREIKFTGAKGSTGYEFERRAFVKVGSNAEKQVEKAARQLKQYERIRLEASLAHRLIQEKKKRKTAAKRQANKDSVGKFKEWTQMSPKLDNIEMPDQLKKHSSAKPSLNNPATYEGATEIYVGHPAHFPNWSNDWKRRLLAIEDALTRNGKKGLQLMYSSRINPGAHKQPRGYFNFYIIGADGDFVWRKYQTSGANGGNWLYMKHVKTGRMMTTSFETMSKEKQDKLIQKI